MQTGYWDYQHRRVEVNDLGHRCRECKLPFGKLGDALTERRGARTSMRYHAECFSGFADPRSQASSSAHVGVHAGSHFEAAPTLKAGTKMRTTAHFASSSKGVCFEIRNVCSGNVVCFASCFSSYILHPSCPCSGAAMLLSTVIETSAPSKIIMGDNSFGARSSKGVAQLATDACELHAVTTTATAGSGALTAAALEAHNAAMVAAPPQ